MLENELHNRREQHPVITLIMIFLVTGLGFYIVGLFIGFFIALPFYPGSMITFATALEDPISHPELPKTLVYVIQGVATFVGLILAPTWFMAYQRRTITEFFRGHKFDLIPVLVTTFIVIIFMAVNSLFIEWNSAFKFPEFAKGFETWAREKEDAAEQITTFLTKFETPADLIIALIVIAVLPAIGEEIVFRGLIQNELYRATKNVHVSIWIAAILFSAIHLQFFGFVPRLLLGALFGYLYYWSGNLSMAILAHFVNNGVSVIAMYMYQQGAFEYDLESPESAPLNVVMICALLTGGLLYYFYKYFENRKPSINQL